jgi:predicted DNA-binding transcriptional regulator AlpA
MSTDPASPAVVPLPHRPGPGLLQRDRLITTAELAEFLSMPVRTLRQWRYLGVGPKAFRVGRHLRYEPSEVRRWLDQDCTGGQERTA